jgi:GT2 family glycosyltransferase
MWIIKNESNYSQAKPTPLAIAYQPLISIIMPVWKISVTILQQAILSVLNQTYRNWELCIACAEPTDEIRNLVNTVLQKDRRIKVIYLPYNLGIAQNSNEAIKLAQGEYLTFLDHDDVLAPFALYEVVLTLQNHRDADFIYSDEDLITANGKKRFCPHFKPAYNPDLLRSINYITHMMVIRKELGDQLGWFRNGFDGAQDYDLALRVAEKASIIIHIPKVLYHWRQSGFSTTNNNLANQERFKAHLAGEKALRDHLRRINFDAEVYPGPDLTTYRVKYRLSNYPLVSIIIPNKDMPEYLESLVDSILAASTYQNFEIILMDNNSSHPRTKKFYESLKCLRNVQVYHYDQEFNYSTINNVGAKYSKGEFLLFLNNDVKPISPDWLAELVSHAQREEVGAVGPKLYYANRSIQHAGVVVGIKGFAGHAHRGFPDNHPGYVNRLRLVQNYSSVTGACLLTKRNLFFELGGFDEDFQIALGDIDYCLKIILAGKLIVWTPYAELYHFESLTRGYEDQPDKLDRFNKEIERFNTRWQWYIHRGDPYYSPNLTLDQENFSINLKDIPSVITRPRVYDSKNKSWIAL